MAREPSAGSDWGKAIGLVVIVLVGWLAYQRLVPTPSVAPSVPDAQAAPAETALEPEDLAAEDALDDAGDAADEEDSEENLDAGFEVRLETANGVHSADEADLAIQLLPTADGGAGAASVQRTDPQGVAHFGRLSGGQYLVALDDPRFAEISQETDIAEGGNETLVLVLDEAADVEGDVSDQDGHPVPGVTLTFGPDSSLTRTTGPDGRFVCERCPASATELDLDGPEGYTAAIDTLALHRGSNPPLHLVLQRLRPLEVVVDFGGVPPEAGETRVALKGPGGFEASQELGTGNRARFEGVPPQDVQAEVDDDTGALAEAAVPAGASAMEVQVPVNELEVVVVGSPAPDPEHPVLVQCAGGESRVQVPDRGGRARFRWLPAKPCEVQYDSRARATATPPGHVKLELPRPLAPRRQVRYETKPAHLNFAPEVSMRVLVADDLSEDGIAVLRKAPGLQVDVKTGLKPQELIDIIGEYDALAVRSATKVTAQVFEAGKKLKVVGRAGVGVDNIDLTAASRRGVVVMNAPGGSSVTVAELTVAMMFALARQVPAATASVKSGKWEKKKFAGGHELSGKTLGVVGTGNIGSVVVDRAYGLKMNVVTFDPYISAEAAARLGVKLLPLDELLRTADFVTLHVPLTESTRNLIGEKQLGLMKKGAFLVNCARGGLVDEAALAKALSSGHLGGAAFDVFAAEPPAADNPLFALPNFVCTPHLGASTEEAQAAVALAVCEQLVDFLQNGNVRNAVNVPSVSRDVMEVLGPFLTLAERLGSLVGQLAAENMTEFRVTVAGAITQQPRRPLALAALRGLLSRAVEGPVNDVSAPAIAQERGIQLFEEMREKAQDFASLITVTAKGPKGETTASGTVFGREPRLLRLDQFEVESVPEGVLLVLRNQDVPGVIGQIGQTLGEAGLNIARMALSRRTAQKEALSILNLDSPAPEALLQKLRALAPIREVRQIQL